MASVVTILAISAPGVAGTILGADNRAGLWEDQLYSNIKMYFSREFLAGNLSSRQMQKVADDMMKKPSATLHVCGTQEQAQHPRMLAGAGVACTPGPATTTGRTALYDLTCHDKSKFHVVVDFDRPTHAVVTLKDASPKQGQPAQIAKHDLRWLSSDCGDLKPGEMR